jgi:hypothetical protein
MNASYNAFFFFFFLCFGTFLVLYRLVSLFSGVMIMGVDSEKVTSGSNDFN